VGKNTHVLCISTQMILDLNLLKCKNLLLNMKQEMMNMLTINVFCTQVKLISQFSILLMLKKK